VKRIATCTDQRSIVPETNALLFANCDQAFFNSLSLMFAFKGRRTVFYSAAADCVDHWCAQQETGL
jgi:hypothetical protein